jgi:hypothetical protein
MTVLLFFTLSCNATDDDRGEGILVLEADIILTDY